MSADTNKWLKQFLEADPAIAAKLTGIHPGNLRHAEPPYLYYRRTAVETDEALHETEWKHDFNLEMWAARRSDLDGPDGLVELIRNRLSNHTGDFGDGTVMAVSVSDADSDFEWRGAEPDNDLYAEALQVEIEL